MRYYSTFSWRKAYSRSKLNQKKSMKALDNTKYLPYSPRERWLHNCYLENATIVQKYINKEWSAIKRAMKAEKEVAKLKQMLLDNGIEVEV